MASLRDSEIDPEFPELGALYPRFVIEAWQRADNARRREARYLARRNRTCEHCDVKFTPPRSDARYCSSRCRQAAYRARSRLGSRAAVSQPQRYG